MFFISWEYLFSNYKISNLVYYNYLKTKMIYHMIKNITCHLQWKHFQHPQWQWLNLHNFFTINYNILVEARGILVSFRGVYYCGDGKTKFKWF